MEILTDLFSDNVISALGWSLFNILWQGFLVAFIIGITLHIFRKKSAQIRYLISVASLLLIVGLSVFNFYNNYETNLSTINNSIQVSQINYTEDLNILNPNNSNIDLSYTDIITTAKDKLKKIDKYFPVIVNIWLIGVLFFIMKFIFSYLYTNRLKRIKSNSITEIWLNKFEKIEQKLQLKKGVKYIESTIVKIPFVLGYLKPVIVIPAEMLTGIPSNQIEAIIAHELAHIRRNDYIINVLQTIIETVFFFHPAVWYISSKIRTERENCCDDIALTVCEGSLIYAKALVSVQEFTLKRHYAAVAFSGRKKHLLNRIKRMIMKPKEKSNFTDKIIASLIILSGILALSFTYTTRTTDNIVEPEIFKSETIFKTESPVIKKSTNSINRKHEVIVRDTVKIKKSYRDNFIDIDDNTITRTFNDNGKKRKMKFTLNKGKVTELYVDGKKIPENEYDKYQPEIDETIADLKDAKEDIRDAMKDIEELDIEEIRKEVEEAMKDVHFDMEEMQVELAKAMEDVKEIDLEKILKDVELELNEIKEMDFDFDFDFDISGETFHFDMEDLDLEKIREEMEKVRESIHENIDMEEIQKEMQKVQEELSKINTEEIRIQMEKNLNHVEEFDKKQTVKELEEKLEELESLELEEK